MAEKKEQKKQHCQDCKLHTNKPSYCRKFKKHIPRKDDICSEFKK